MMSDWGVHVVVSVARLPPAVEAVSSRARPLRRALLALGVVTSSCGRASLQSPSPAAHERLVNPIVRQRADPQVSRDSAGHYDLAIVGAL